MTDSSAEHASLLTHELSMMNFGKLVGIMGRVQRRIWSPWAVLLVRFSDDTAEVPRRDLYEQLFTSQGAGEGNNMVDSSPTCHTASSTSRAQRCLVG